ncbi:hypothetical protein BEI64_03330 [Eisenbergiella tayi]|uniref:Uncharacterized protein n=1 Tax=Eisenbergiella tayi TaxID=1432052 RepID=A0ABX3ABP6_9FIRM|nr:hypothetical protein BEI62_06145 [Eisenbergiella tayi]ODR46600.1 hypothetical protein BEI63_27835 [Eisenbergiella tayi]ODR62655.1 hypothetical protein BEI64_03330 [Eisenbergiella tayi]
MNPSLSILIIDTLFQFVNFINKLNLYSVFGTFYYICFLKGNTKTGEGLLPESSRSFLRFSLFFLTNARDVYTHPFLYR